MIRKIIFDHFDYIGKIDRAIRMTEHGLHVDDDKSRRVWY